jgi:hypothetical protein
MTHKSIRKVNKTSVFNKNGNLLSIVPKIKIENLNMSNSVLLNLTTYFVKNYLSIIKLQK